jgi:hypothetical protein
MTRKRTLRSKTGGGQFKKSYDTMRNTSYSQSLRDGARSAIQQLLASPKYRVKSPQELFEMDSKEGDPKFADLKEATQAWNAIFPDNQFAEPGDRREEVNDLARRAEAERLARLEQRQRDALSGLAGQSAAATGRAADCEKELAAARASVELLQQQILADQQKFLEAIERAEQAGEAVEAARSEQELLAGQLSANEMELLALRAFHEKSGEFQAIIAGLTEDKARALAELETLRGSPELAPQLAEQIALVAQLTASVASLNSLNEEKELDNTVIQGELERLRAYAEELLGQNEGLTEQLQYKQQLEASLEKVTTAMRKKHENLESEIAGLMALLETERSKLSISSSDLQDFTQRHAAALREAKEASDTLVLLQKRYEDTLRLNKPVLEKYPEVLADNKRYKLAFEEAEVRILQIVERTREFSKRVDVDIDFLLSQILPTDDSSLSVYKNLMFHDALNTAYYVKKAFLIGLNADTTQVDMDIEENMKELLPFKEKFEANAKECDSLFDGLIALEARFGMLKEQHETLKAQLKLDLEKLRGIPAILQEFEQTLKTSPETEVDTEFKDDSTSEFQRVEQLIKLFSEQTVGLGSELEARQVALSGSETSGSESKLQRLREKLEQDVEYFSRVTQENLEQDFFSSKDKFNQELGKLEKFQADQIAKRIQLSAKEQEQAARAAEVSQLEQAFRALEAKSRATEAAAAAAAAAERAAVEKARESQSTVTQQQGELGRTQAELKSANELLSRLEREKREATGAEVTALQRALQEARQQQQQVQAEQQQIQQRYTQAEQEAVAAGQQQQAARGINEHLRAQVADQAAQLEEARGMVAQFNERLAQEQQRLLAEKQQEGAKVAQRFAEAIAAQRAQLEVEKQAALAEQRARITAGNVRAIEEVQRRNAAEKEEAKRLITIQLAEKDREFRRLRGLYEHFIERINGLKIQLRDEFKINVEFAETDTQVQRLNKLIGGVKENLTLLAEIKEPEVDVRAKPGRPIVQGEAVDVIVNPKRSTTTTFIVIIEYEDGFNDSLVVQTVGGRTQAEYVIKRGGSYVTFVFAL